MKKQKGFYDIDLTSAIVTLCIICFVIGWGLAIVVPWVWAWLKPILHNLTA